MRRHGSMSVTSAVAEVTTVCLGLPGRGAAPGGEDGGLPHRLQGEEQIVQAAVASQNRALVLREFGGEGEVLTYRRGGLQEETLGRVRAVHEVVRAEK